MTKQNQLTRLQKLLAPFKGVWRSVEYVVLGGRRDPGMVDDRRAFHAFGWSTDRRAEADPSAARCAARHRQPRRRTVGQVALVHCGVRSRSALAYHAEGRGYEV